MYLQVLGPSSRSLFRVPALFQVVRRIQGWMEKKMANLLEESYRMPKPQHVDEKLYEKIVLLLVLFLFLSSYSSNIYFQSSSHESCMRSSKLNQFFFLNEPT